MVFRAPRVLPLFLCIASLFFVSPNLYAQQALQSPDDFLGYALGSRYTEYHRVIDYFEYVAETVPHVSLESYGETYEGRPLVTAFLTSPERIGDLDAIRLNNLRRAGLEDGSPDDDKTSIVWLSYNVHGNETVSTEAALKTLHKLANPNDEQSLAWLANAVVVIDPCLNPDGRDRYVYWYNQTVGRFPNANPLAREHAEPWPRGRTNHYYFDLNRDWAWMTQKEVQARVAHYSRWMPHIHVDFHEQGVNSPYFFAPAAEPYHTVITSWQRQFQLEIGANHARYFDANNWLYFTREVFDLFYPGYGDTWPSFNGSIGMTYEQGGGGAGLQIKTEEGDTLTLGDRIEHHYITGLSTVEISAINNERLVDAFAEYYRLATMTPPGPYRSYVIKGMDNKNKRKALEHHLHAQGIEFGYATTPGESTGLRYRDQDTVLFPIDPGDMLISAYQPKANLVKALLEPEPVLPDSLTYDITSWSLPYVYGFDAYALQSQLIPETETYPLQDAGSLVENETPYAYLANWTSFNDARFLAAVLRQNIKLRYAQKPFRIEGRSYGAGALILTRRGNEAMGETFDKVIREAAEEYGIALHAVRSGRVSEGSDFGSNQVLFLKKPKIALLSGSPTQSYAMGEVWHYFDQQLGYPITLLNAASFSVSQLDGFDTLILPNGAYNSVMNGEALEALTRWIRQGGKVIALESAVNFLAGKDGFSIKAKPRATVKDSTVMQRKYGDRNRGATQNRIPGAIFRVQLDTTHPLGFGMSEDYFTLKRRTSAFNYLESNSDWNVGILTKDAHVSGFAGHATLPHVEESLGLGVQQMGRGRVVYMVDNPIFRAFWYNGRHLLANAVFMVQ